MTIINPVTGQTVKVHAVYDSCDSNLECSLATAQKLGLELTPLNISINNFGHSRTEKGFTSEIQMVDCLGKKHSEEILVTDSLQFTTPAVKFEHLPEDVRKVFGDVGVQSSCQIPRLHDPMVVKPTAKKIISSYLRTPITLQMR